MKHTIKQKSHITSGFIVMILVITSVTTTCMGSELWARGRSVVVSEGRSIMLQFNEMHRVQIANPEVADVVIASKKALAIYGKSRGVTTLYVWDKVGLHKYEVNVTGSLPAERVARELRQAIALGLQYTVAGEDILVIEGAVQTPEAAQRARSISDAYADMLTIVDLISVEGTPQIAAEATATALKEVLTADVEYKVLDERTLVVQGDVPDEAELNKIEKVLAAVETENVKIVNLVQYNESIASPPLSAIREAIGDRLQVWQVRGRTVAIDGTVETQTEADRISKILEGFSDQANIIDLVQVVPPRPEIEAYAKKLETTFGEDIGVKVVGPETIAVQGSVPTEEMSKHYQEILNTMEHPYKVVNYLRVVEPDKEQIEVQCLVADLSHGAIEKYGVRHGQAKVNPETGEAQFADQPYLFKTEQGVNNWYMLGAQVEALLDDTDSEILARPRVLVNDGGEAEILVGGEIPVPVLQSDSGGTNIGIEYEPYGVTLTIKPALRDDGKKIKLEVQPTVSALDWANGVTVSGFDIPALTKRSAATTVTVPDGGTLGIGGLLKREDVKTVREIPVLSKIPIIGELFKHKSFQQGKSELVIFVTPRIATADVHEPGYKHPADEKVQEIQTVPQK